MTDEEWSEFAEALHSACETEHVSARGDCYCPIGALLLDYNRLPTPDEAHAALQYHGVTFDDVDDFIKGFDGDGWLVGQSGYGFTLGLAFREMYP